jgi:DNA polymerase I-like protein with 3'-5' exonuclease and polymerase domains
MKTCTLGIIYELSAFGLDNRLEISKKDASALLDRFMFMFPSLRLSLE